MLRKKNAFILSTVQNHLLITCHYHLYIIHSCVDLFLHVFVHLSSIYCPFTYPISLKFVCRYSSFSIYLAGLFGWCGFWIFSFFCGAGLTSLPFDMIMVFVYRPMKMDPEELHSREIELQGREREGL